MANTFTQIHIQTIFAVKNRTSLIQKSWKCDLYQYISGIIQNNNHKVLAINGMPDHIHIFFGMRPSQSLSSLIQDVKACSARWVNCSSMVRGKFEWQSGYGAFSYSKSQVPNVISYIENQEIHHQKKSFIEEYHDFLLKFNIQYDPKYTFQKIL
ncbi:IS200/IS605 family transposase [Cytophagaceae bacterium ABcell3]|nr:IS200/IS605 family transposase [Cytophagaceae bacterium ABcell3]